VPVDSAAKHRQRLQTPHLLTAETVHGKLLFRTIYVTTASESIHLSVMFCDKRVAFVTQNFTVFKATIRFSELSL
jgi:hypothetical protein